MANHKKQNQAPVKVCYRRLWTNVLFGTAGIIGVLITPIAQIFFRKLHIEGIQIN
jgi:hypothetical protein